MMAEKGGRRAAGSSWKFKFNGTLKKFIFEQKETKVTKVKNKEGFE
ncbi:MAG: hypothetical protein LBC18_07795 [Opitutaceae bacterium]|jgi:hypothetical protein|nr:hypothetical protein [Opitutaceae bacterium]